MGAGEIIKWNKSYSVGIEEIDKQHKKFFEIINKLYYLDDDDNNKFKKIVEELYDYTIYHFKSEEEYLQKAGYPHLKEHQNVHQNFVKKIKELKELDKIPDDIDLFEFASEWLIDHILNTDQKYAFWIMHKKF